MSLTKVVSVALNMLGILLCLLAIIAGGISAIAFSERIQQGPGIMFADVEFFAFGAAVFLASGITLLIVARYLKKRFSHSFKPPQLPFR